EVVLLDVLAVVPLAVRQTEEPLLEDGVLAVPQGDGEAQELVVVGDPGQAVLSPAIRPRARLIVAEVIPRVARIAVVLADGAPLAPRKMGPPFPPGPPLLARLRQPPLLGPLVSCHHRVLLIIAGLPSVFRSPGPVSQRRPGGEPFKIVSRLQLIEVGH